MGPLRARQPRKVIKMMTRSYVFTFPESTDMQQIEESLLLATMSAEGLHGRTRIQLEASYSLDSEERKAVVGAESEVGEAIARIFAALLSLTVGESGFQVQSNRREECA